MSFQEEMAKLKRLPKRPASLIDLLVHVIAPNPFESRATMDTEWAAQHAATPRFRIGGMQWYRDMTGLNGDDLFKFSGDAVKAAKSCGWKDMLGIPRSVARKLEIHWDSTARPQYFVAIKGHPLSFVKAAQILLSCELALQSLVDQQEGEQKAKKRSASDSVTRRPELLSEISSGKEIYQHMALIPACWNINDFNANYLESRTAAVPSFIEQLAAYTGQTDFTVFDALAAGNTVTYGLARKIKEFCDPNKPLGQIRCRRGKGILGSKRAAELEELPP
jgi:hypothetical protein